MTGNITVWQIYKNRRTIEGKYFLGAPAQRFLPECWRFRGHWRWDGAQPSCSDSLSEAKVAHHLSQKPPLASLTSELSLTESKHRCCTVACWPVPDCCIVFTPYTNMNKLINENNSYHFFQSVITTFRSIWVHTWVSDLPAEFFEPFEIWKAVKQELKVN